MLRICCALIDIIFIENELEDVIRFFRDNDRKEGVTAMRIRPTLLRAEQSRAEQSRLTAPFLRLAGRLKLHITFVMDNRRT